MIQSTFFATCPKHLEGLLRDELISLGAFNAKQTLAGVEFSGDLTLAYRVCLWSRLANRVLLPLAKVDAKNADILYKNVSKINWLEHLKPTDTLVIDFAGTSKTINNSHFGALKVKDAIVDQFRERTGQRPTIEKENPALRINVYLYNDIATISIDLSGESLHKRGYRGSAGSAPLKENLAAAILYRANWPELAKQGKPLLDPMCGSGTILIEAAMMAADIAPGLLRNSFGFTHWLKHNERIWNELWVGAKARRERGLENLNLEIRGYDSDLHAINNARRNIKRAGLDDSISVVVKELSKFTPPTHYGKQVGVIVTNPPYGERLGEGSELITLYRTFGQVLRERFLDWEVAMLTSNPDLGKTMRLRAYKQYSFFNGAILCKLFLFKVAEQWFVKSID
jgi:23S rRNA (guanine2445-N2)-methyltransferase / 23S rRNA (guanine2069-N7)-methyltransferase